MGDEEDIEEEAEGEVEKVLFELTDGLLGQAGNVGAPLEVIHSYSSMNSLTSIHEPSHTHSHSILSQKQKEKNKDIEARLQALKAT